MARLPFSAEREESRHINLRSSNLPVRYEHPIREINDHMDDIVYNAIDVIQERSRDSGLRTFYFNLMADDQYRNKDFEKIVSMIADVVDISITEGKFRDVRDAILPVVEDVLTLHIGYLTEDFPDLLDYVDRNADRDISRAVRTFEKYIEAIKVYRRNGNSVPRDGGRDRDRDRYDDRDRDRGGRGGANFGSSRDDRGGARRDRWDRGAVRGGVHGSPRRNVAQRDNRFGNTDQSDRFNELDGAPAGTVVDDPRDNGRDRDRDDRYATRGSSDRFDDLPAGQTRRRDEGTSSAPRSHVQRIPGRSGSHSDVEDALARENQPQGNSTMATDNNADEFAPLLARKNQDVWLPTVANPHPLVFNHNQELYYVIDAKNSSIIPKIVNKDQLVDYYAHESMAMGPVPKDFARFDDGGMVAKRLDTLHTALMNPKEVFQVDGGPETVTYHSRFELENTFLSYTLKDSMVRLGYRRFVKEREQPAGEGFHQVEIAVATSMTIEAFPATPEECDFLEELRQISSFTKLSEKMRGAAKKVRAELWLQLDRYLTQAVIRMLRQNLSIPTVTISSFTSDWLELFSWVTEQYGDGYRDAINTHQEREIRHLLNSDAGAEIYVLSQLEDGASSVLKPYVMAVPTKLIYLNEIGFNLDIDMVGDVASQILPESNAFFHDLAQDLLKKGGTDDIGRFYIQTADMRVIEASRSFMNESAILLRMIK